MPDCRGLDESVPFWGAPSSVFGNRASLAAELYRQGRQSFESQQINRSILARDLEQDTEFAFFPLNRYGRVEPQIVDELGAQDRLQSHQMPSSSSSVARQTLQQGSRSPTKLLEWPANQFPDYKRGVKSVLEQALIEDPSFFENNGDHPCRFTGVLVSRPCLFLW